MSFHGCAVTAARLTTREIDGVQLIRQEIHTVVDGTRHLHVTTWVEPKEVARVQVEPHDPYRNLCPVTTLLPGQLLVKLPGDAEWRHLGLMADTSDAAEIAWQYQQQDAVRSYAWVDGEGQITAVSDVNTEGS